jgi:8-amino-3,8-dideoxy-alpha-D-manno-octulosonate transaminase
LNRLDFVLTEQQKHKEQIKEEIHGISGIEFRDLPDPKGDGGDTLAFFLPNIQTAKAFNEALARMKIDTKILPSAMHWHFVGHWNHLISYCPPFRTDAWPKSEALLRRAIALPISVRMSQEQIKRTIEAVKQAAQETL